ncbi:MAG: hypothetical protein LUH11_02740 [Candidatus Gastranaerophilales bacterium]|nr:hypothetical protein [Candidatus Gastranaerophilales bacterium]
MINTIYIAENNIDSMFEIETPEYNTETEALPPLPDDTAQSSELAFMVNKSFISFGTMIICIIIIIAAAFIIKNRKQTKDASAHEIFAQEDSDLINNDSSEYITKPQQNNKFSTSGSIHNCILSFLERTKDI